MRSAVLIGIKLIFTLSSFLLNYLAANSQNIPRDKHKWAFNRGIAAADHGNHLKAMEIFASILRESPDHVNSLTQLGVTFMDTNQNLDSAKIIFNRVLSLLPPGEQGTPFGFHIHQLLARAYNLSHKPDEALARLTEIEMSSLTEDMRLEVERDIRNSLHARLLINNPVALAVEPISGSINSEFDDHSPVFCPQGNKIYFTSRRPLGKSRLMPDGQYPENVFVSELAGDVWKKPVPVKEFHRRNQHTSILSISPDENEIFLLRTDRVNFQNIFSSSRVDGKWGKPKELPYPVNSRWDETHASLSPSLDTLYFTSNRPGGFGGLDIYLTTRDADGEWGEPVNLGPSINTSLNEDAAMVHPNGQLLYFISEGHNSMGGYDVFYSYRLDDGSWARAVNMGYPVNSTDDDLLFFPVPDKSRAFMSSYRYTGTNSGANLYAVNFDDDNIGSLAVVEGNLNHQYLQADEKFRMLAWGDGANLTHEINLENIASVNFATEFGKRLNNALATAEQINYAQPKIGMVNDVSTILLASNAMVSGAGKMIAPLTRHLNLEVENNLQMNVTSVTNVEIKPVEPMPSHAIQILALLRSRTAPPTFFEGLNLSDIVTFEGQDGFLRFVSGRFNDRDQAREHLEMLRQTGRFKDAWIRDLQDIQSISNSEALPVPNK